MRITMSKLRNLLFVVMFFIPGASFAANTTPIITSANAVTFTLGQPNTFTVKATGTPIPTFTETGALPAGVTLSAAGILSGTPTVTLPVGKSGVYPITITAANGVTPNATQSFTLTVNPLHYVALTWVASTSTGVASYNIYRTQCLAPTATVGGSQNISCPAGAPASVVIGSTSGTAWQDNNVQPGQSYQYNVTAVCPACQYIASLTGANVASGGNTTYSGTFTTSLLTPGVSTAIAGFINAGNNGSFPIVSDTSTNLVVINAGGVAETHAGTATVPATESVPSSSLTATDPPAAPTTVIIPSSN
jgi:hypothetical protein